MKAIEKSYIDEWLKKQIKNGVNIIGEVLDGKKDNVVYYTGHLHKDILDNFPGKTSKKIFKSYRVLLDNKLLAFTQKKFSEHGYEYMVRRINEVK
jgi:hypothetical protein